MLSCCVRVTYWRFSWTDLPAPPPAGPTDALVLPSMVKRRGAGALGLHGGAPAAGLLLDVSLGETPGAGTQHGCFPPMQLHSHWLLVRLLPPSIEAVGRG